MSEHNITEAQIAKDQALSHVVEVVHVCPVEEDKTAEAIANAFTRANARALQAGMVICSQTVSIDTCVGVHGPPFLTVVLTGQWVKRSDLERMQREQMFAAGVRGGPKGMV